MFIWVFTEELRDELRTKGYKEIKPAVPVSTGSDNRPIWIFDAKTSSIKVDFSSKPSDTYLMTQKIFL